MSTTTCKACGSTDLSWSLSTRRSTNSSGASDGRLRMNDVIPVAILGCDVCSETIAVIEAAEAARYITMAYSAPLAGVTMRNTWKPGERVELVERPGGTYSPEVTRPGTVMRVEDHLYRHEHLVVRFDDGETRAINPDVMRHQRGKAYWCANTDAPQHYAHGWPLKIEAWGTCPVVPVTDQQAHAAIVSATDEMHRKGY